jgi:hypothetical protein
VDTAKRLQAGVRIADQNLHGPTTDLHSELKQGHKEVAMLLKETMHKPAEQVAQSIERQIVQRTWGRIHRLAVEVIDDRVIVHGCTSTYYCKQLALEGVLDVLGSSRSTQVELDIQVGCASVQRAINRLPVGTLFD